MRKFLMGAAIVIVIVGIALAVRGQLRRTQPAQAAASPATDTTAVQPMPEPQPVAPQTPTGTATTSGPTPAGNPQRPVVSDKVPSIVPRETDEAAADQQVGANVLRRASTAYGRIKSMRADFVQRRENPLLNSTSTSRGTLYQRDPDRFALKFSQPAGDVIIGDGRYFWLYYPSVDRKQVIRADAAQGAGAVDLKSQFIGDPLTRFTHRYHGTEQRNGRTTHVLTLTPRGDAGYRTLKVWIDGSDYLVRRFQIIELNGAEVEFQLSNITPNPTLGNEIFRFTPPADAKVIER